MRSAPTFPYCHMAKVAAARTISRGLLAIVGPVDSVNLWKTSFWKGYMDCASAQALSTGSLAFLSAAPLKTANPQPLVSKIWAFSLI